VIFGEKKKNRFVRKAGSGSAYNPKTGIEIKLIKKW
jgi:hypothetical protein